MFSTLRGEYNLFVCIYLPCALYKLDHASNYELMAPAIPGEVCKHSFSLLFHILHFPDCFCSYVNTFGVILALLHAYWPQFEDLVEFHVKHKEHYERNNYDKF